MELAIRLGATSDHPSDYEAEERNRSFGPMPDNCAKCIADDRAKKMLVVVPPRLPGITCQTDTKAFESLIECFKAVILASVETGSKSIAIPPLGVRYHHWSVLQSSTAARRAIDTIAEIIPDDFRIVFTVGDKDEDLKIWDEVLTFVV
jgi:hypothetical protein